MRAIRVSMPDGSQWDVPLDVVMENFRAYWEPRSSEPLVFDDSELLDWAEAAMVWDLVKDQAIQVPTSVTGTVNYQAGWIHGDKAIVEVEALGGEVRK